MTSYVDKSETSLPLTLTVEKVGIGGITGLAPTVAVRNASTTNSYLDFGDNTFKTMGWIQKYATMVELERGHYVQFLNVATLPLPAGGKFTAEYHVDNGTDIKGDDSETYLVTNLVTDSSLTRKYMTNRQHYASGNPGQLQLYDDDDLTVLRTHAMRDESGGAVLPATGSPARRAKGV